MKAPLSARKININGVVQGVGFRPYIFVLARRHRLNGEVANTDEGIRIFIEGRADHIDAFMADLPRNPPILATITTMSEEEAAPRGARSFKIVKSTSTKRRTTLISPDVATCADCLNELNDPVDPRYEYPFINCTNCGPRYTIIKDIPYDRPKTSMTPFTMCADCRKEYDDPLDRRFHAQPNACPDCGPQVMLADPGGAVVTRDPKKALDEAAQLLGEGKILAIKGLGGFHLACDATDAEAVQRLRKLKNRPHKPFALMARDTGIAQAVVAVSAAEKIQLTSYQSPIVLMRKRTDPAPDSICPAPEVAPLNNYLGIMLPNTPLHHLLLKKGPALLVMTSGNRSGEPLSIDNDDAVDAFSHIADSFLLHNREIFFRADDSVLRVHDDAPFFIRRSRGYAPLPVYLDHELPPILGCGAGLKNTICLTRNRHAFLSPHIGDLDNAKVFEYFKQTIDHLERILDIRPETIAHDLHPGYMSSEFASGMNDVKTFAVQHHHAHAVSCMAENHLNDPVIAITLDGTGYGTDGHIWGGEILVATRDEFTRQAHLAYLPMPGGDAAVLEPWRMAIAVLHHLYGSDLSGLRLPLLDRIGPEKTAFICQMMDQKINTPLTSSAGRLFDAMSALLGICHQISYESQAAMELEAAAMGHDGRELPFEMIKHRADTGSINDKTLPGPMYEINLLPAMGRMIEEIAEHPADQAPDAAGQISADFHATLCRAFCDTAAQVSTDTGINTIVLSGGVFNNAVISKTMTRQLTRAGLTVYTHTQVPAGDGGISLGQVTAAAARIEKEK